ncbi:MAG: 50S ribosomal protein L23 [Acidobacteriota bacterium]|nr:50S ribosomal protein L23 [Blastocatellia bacterium]MDW8241005.1 50S ribosomal protein L23 [Acidobacteriota bacterium]
MQNVWDVIKAPVVTEKALSLKDRPEDEGPQVLVFRVNSRATKTSVKQAVERIFKVQVEQVRIVNQRGKRVFRFGRLVGRKSDWKKAYVTLKPGHRITEYAEVI